MSWYHYLACFVGGAFLANFVPHFVAGVSGRTFPTPFASPPFRGESPPEVNILWSLVNLVAAYVLLVPVARLDWQRAPEVATAATGFALAAIGIARSLRRLQRTS